MPYVKLVVLAHPRIGKNFVFRPHFCSNFSKFCQQTTKYFYLKYALYDIPECKAREPSFKLILASTVHLDARCRKQNAKNYNFCASHNHIFFSLLKPTSSLSKLEWRSTTPRLWFWQFLIFLLRNPPLHQSEARNRNVVLNKM